VGARKAKGVPLAHWRIGSTQGLPKAKPSGNKVIPKNTSRTPVSHLVG